MSRSVSSLTVLLLIGSSFSVGGGPLAVAAPHHVAVAAAAPAPSLPPRPGPETIDSGKTPGAFASLSGPRVLHPGDSVKLTYGSTSPDVRWRMDAGLPETSGDCPSAGSQGRHTCTLIFSKSLVLDDPSWYAPKIYFEYTPSCFFNGCFTTTTWSEPIALIPDKRSVLTGSVRDANDVMVRGVPIRLRGADATYETTTAGDGTFSALLPTGRWTVTPEGTWDPASRTVKLTRGGAQAHFKAPVYKLDFDIEGSHLINGLDWTTAQASGLNWRSGTLVAHTEAGRAVTDSIVELDAPYLDGTHERSPNVVCDASWRPLFATADRAERITDGSGRIPTTVLFGNQISTSQWHARLQSDITALDVEILGALGSPSGPVADAITTPMQNAKRLGLPLPPLFAADQGALQAGLAEWWLAYRSGENAGPQSLPAFGDFAPVRSANGSSAALVFYPAGDPTALRVHLRSGAPLPEGYPTLVLAFRQSVIDLKDGSFLSWTVGLQGLPTLQAWEAEHGAAVDGFLSTGPGLGAGWLGGPIPPVVTDRTARIQYARCVPGASTPATLVEVHSPIAVSVSEKNGDFQIADGKNTADVFVVPGSSSLTLRGTGRGPVELLVRRGGEVRLFSFTARSGATGSLSIGTSSKVRFAGRSVPGKAPALRVTATPKMGRAGRPTAVKVRVLDAFGDKVEGARVSVRGPGVNQVANTSTKGLVRLKISPSKAGKVRINATNPGAAKGSTTVRVR